MRILDQARRYLDKIPPAISGQGGHDQTFHVACVLVQGFGLSIDDARGLMLEYSARCIPPWRDHEIEHKLRDAERTPEPKGRGYLIRKSLKHIYRGDPEPPRPAPAPLPKAEKKEPKHYGMNGEIKLPEPMANGAEELLLAAFEAGEGIRICLATTNEEGREVPRDQGITLSREEWLHKLEENGGNPNGILRSSANNGIFISVNPLKLGGSKDADVTAYRHALLEFDNISQQEQWNIIVQSGIPCAAVIYSGGKSLHAWVKVDAQDRKEYDERVAILYNHFEAYKPDVKNKNPSRFSRLPNCVRGPKRQELLALKIGAESFSEWMISQDAEDLGQEITIASLLEFRAEEDPNCILGDRWLCRGGSCLFVGQSGIGKSSLAVQAAILWSLDMSLFGIKPKRALRSLFIQAENDLGDIAEMFQGVWQGMNLPGADKPEVIRQVNDNVFFRTIDSLTGYDFTQAVRRLIDKYKPDLVWLDPLLSYIGDDISKQSVCSQFLRNWLNPISKATGVCWMMMHHTNKPPSDPKARKGWNQSDFAYMGSGSSELVNWARAVCVLRKLDDHCFELMLAKRGLRAGAKDFNLERTTKLTLAHSAHGICWQQIAESEAEEKPKEEKPSRPFDYDAFLGSVKDEHFTATQLVERVLQFSRVSRAKAFAKILPELKMKMQFDPEHRTYSI